MYKALLYIMTGTSAVLQNFRLHILRFQAALQKKGFPTYTKEKKKPTARLTSILSAYARPSNYAFSVNGTPVPHSRHPLKSPSLPSASSSYKEEKKKPTARLTNVQSACARLSDYAFSVHGAPVPHSRHPLKCPSLPSAPSNDTANHRFH